MWGTNVDDPSRRHEGRQANQWHNEPEEGGRQGIQNPHDADGGSSDSPDSAGDGTWGEKDTGIPDERAAMQDYEALRRELTQLSQTRSRDSKPTRTQSHRLAARTKSRRSTATRDTEDAGDTEAQEAKEEEDFELDDFLREGHFGEQHEGRSAKKVGVLYKNLTVKGVGSTATFVKTLPSAIVGTFGPDLYRILSGFIPALRFGGGETRVLIDDFSGVVRDGKLSTAREHSYTD